MGKVFEGKSNIKVTVIADSISPAGQRITTFELEYPRIIHSELMTHRLFSRNAMSSRAVPIKKMVELIRTNPAMPVRFGANQAGMQDKGVEHDGQVWYDWTETEDGLAHNLFCKGREAWMKAAENACEWAERFDKAGYHKQVANRLIEPFQMMKTVLTSTTFNNFWWLRLDADADPTFEHLTEVMKEAILDSTPEPLKPGEWHTPYVHHAVTLDGSFYGYYVVNEEGFPVDLTEEEALAISASCCAQVSYRRLDETKEKALGIYERLVDGKKVHASPFEHQATPLSPYREIENSDFLTIGTVNNPADPKSWQKGITHVDREGKFWSGNLCGFVQQRQLLKNNFVSG